MPLWNSTPQNNFSAETFLGDDADQESHSSIMCEDRPVRELVNLCIMKRVSSVNNVLLLRVIKPVPPLQILGFVQVNTVLFPNMIVCLV